MEPYVASAREHLEGAADKIVYGKFQIAAHLANAVDQVRRAENKQLRASDDERLKGAKCQWLRHPARLSEAACREFRRLLDTYLRTARALALKETAMRLFEYRSNAATRRFFALWPGWLWPGWARRKRSGC